MKKNYPYPYEFVVNRDDGDFPDKSKYRFVLIPTGQIVGNTGGGPGTHSAGAVDFYFYDRMTGTKYPNLQKGSYSGMVTFKPLIKTIVRHTGGVKRMHFSKNLQGAVEFASRLQIGDDSSNK